MNTISRINMRFSDCGILAAIAMEHDKVGSISKVRDQRLWEHRHLDFGDQEEWMNLLIVFD